MEEDKKDAGVEEGGGIKLENRKMERNISRKDGKRKEKNVGKQRKVEKKQ